MENMTNNPFGNVQFFNAVGKRSEATGVEKDVIIAEGTAGSFKIMPEVATKLGIVDGSFVVVQTAEIDGELKVLIGKGKDGVLAVDENGQPIVDGRHRRTFEIDGFGAMVTEVNPGTNIFRFSVASAWRDLGRGEGETKGIYKLGQSGVVDLPVGDGEFHNTTLYILDFVRNDAKSTTVGAKKKEVSAETNVEGMETQEAPNSVIDLSSSPSSNDNFEQGYEENLEL